MIFFACTQCILKTFNQRLINVCNKWTHSGINHWPKEFFQSASSQTQIREQTQSNLVQAPWDRVSKQLDQHPKFKLIMIGCWFLRFHMMAVVCIANLQVNPL